MSALKIGDHVLCRYYNTPERRFYGETFTAEIISINAYQDYKDYSPPHSPPHKYAARRLRDERIVTLDRREIIRRVK